MEFHTKYSSFIWRGLSWWTTTWVFDLINIRPPVHFFLLLFILFEYWISSRIFCSWRWWYVLGVQSEDWYNLLQSKCDKVSPCSHASFIFLYSSEIKFQNSMKFYNFHNWIAQHWKWIEKIRLLKYENENYLRIEFSEWWN